MQNIMKQCFYISINSYSQSYNQIRVIAKVIAKADQSSLELLITAWEMGLGSGTSARF